MRFCIRICRKLGSGLGTSFFSFKAYGTSGQDVGLGLELGDILENIEYTLRRVYPHVIFIGSIFELEQLLG